jgi:dienelactone hydrolase
MRSATFSTAPLCFALVVASAVSAEPVTTATPATARDPADLVPHYRGSPLAAVSPLQHVDQIKVPLLIAHGGNDPRVKQVQADQIVAALTAHGIEVDYLSKANEGHSFHLEENKMEFYHRAEHFLAKHLGGRELAAEEGSAKTAATK